MKIVYVITIFYLGILAITGVLYSERYIKLHKNWKRILVFIGVLSLIFNLAYKRIEERVEKIRQWHNKMDADYQMRELAKKIEQSKEKKGLFEDTDYLNRICLYLEKLDFNISLLRKRMVKERYFTIYFAEVEKIPDFYTWEEWEETENILFKCLLKELGGYYNREHIRKIKIKEFIKEREKYLKAKEREFNESAKNNNF